MAFAFCHRLLFLSSLLLGILAIGANARPGIHFHPCKTLFISSFTISSIKPRFDTPLNPNYVIPDDQNPSNFFAVFTEINGFDSNQQPFEIFLDRRPDFESLSRSEFQFPRHIRNPNPKIPYGSFGVSSLRERTKDILSVVMALLFGAGCGALTAATMYLAWSLITNRYEFRGSEDDDSEFDEDDDDVSLNKMGYVKIPSAAPTVSPKEVV
ncbi:hypothetical protein BVC80_665g4 [Macleaya cordata]|uniref:Legume lectin domain n=1 Tax=Macleaya cordata TaxID=56857 RepID=A0A200QAR8_MACCD|nr:hypothetical protein BVC80_665g4 [Macleaya cordata]